MPFTMVFIKKNKSRKLGPQEIGKGIISMLLDEFLDCLNYAKKEAV